MGEVLKSIAAQMWSEAAELGRSSRTLSGGLFIVCKVEEGTRKLGLCRQGTHVPYDERVIAAAAFGVPRAAWPEMLPMGGSTWACYTWQYTAEQLSLFEGA